MLYLKIPLSRNLPDVSQTQEKGGGPSRQLSTKLYQCRCLPPRCTSDSVHAAMQISRTNCSRLCGSSSAGTWKNRPNEWGSKSISHLNALAFCGPTGGHAAAGGF